VTSQKGAEIAPARLRSPSRNDRSDDRQGRPIAAYTEALLVSGREREKLRSD